MENVRIRVRHHTCLEEYDFAIVEGKKKLLFVLPCCGWWVTEKAAVRNAKAMAERIGIPYDPEILKEHGC